MGASLSSLELLLQGRREEVSEEARREFAFLLGTFTRNHGVSHRQYRKYDKTFTRSETIERIGRIAALLGTREPRMHGPDNVRIYDQRVTRVLHDALDGNFHNYVSSDNHRIEFLRGFFASSLVRAKEAGGTICYYLCFDEREVRNYVLSAFFELGMYPRPSRGDIVLQNLYNLRRFQELDLDPDEENKAVVARFLEEHKDPRMISIPNYYLARRRVQELVDRKCAVPWAQLSREFDVSENALPRWVSNIVAHLDTTPLRKPLIVASYEEILQELQLPNVYISSVPTRRHEKVFIPMGKKWYQVTPEAQSELAALLGHGIVPTPEDFVFLQGQLRNSYLLGKWLRCVSESDLVIRVEAAPAPGATLLRVDDQAYVLPYPKQQRYLQLYDLSVFDTDCARHFQEELEKYLHDASLRRQKKYRSDLTFRIANHVILDVDFRQGTSGARRWEEKISEETDSE